MGLARQYFQLHQNSAEPPKKSFHCVQPRGELKLEFSQRFLHRIGSHPRDNDT
jgi:hypothetical protein